MKKFSLFYPIKPQTILQVFGVNGAYYQAHGIDIKGHNGLDIKAKHGEPIYATHDGVCYPGVDDKGGNGIVLRTEEEYDYFDPTTNTVRQTHFKTIYWHLVKSDAVVKTGQKVKAGDLIGYADSTGLSTGDHLHFGLKPEYWAETTWSWITLNPNNGYLGNIDPTPYFNGYYAADAKKVLTLLTQLVNLLKQALKP